MTDVRITTELVETLSAIARWYPGTENPPRVTESQTKIAYKSKPPLAADVLSVRRQTIDTLTRWATVVRTGRGFTHPIATTVQVLVWFLADHAEWLAGQPEARQAAKQLAKLADQLEQIVKQTHPARVKIGACPEPDCHGELEAIVRKADTMLPSAIHCSDDRAHVWAPHEWPALGRHTRKADPEAVRRLHLAIFGTEEPQPPAPDAFDVDLPRTYGAGMLDELVGQPPTDHSLEGLIGDTKTSTA